MTVSRYEIFNDDPEQIEFAIQTLLAQARILDKSRHDCTTDYLDLEGFKYIGHIRTSKEILIVAKPTSQYSHCPRCGRNSSKLKNNAWTRRRCVKDEPRGLMHVRVYFQVQRYQCRECGKGSQQPLESLAENRDITERLLSLIHREVFRFPIAAVARQTGVGEQTLHNIFTDYSEELISTVRFETPKRMGIDGVYIGGAERCVITDLDKGRPIALLEECNYASVSRFFIQLSNPKRVELVAMDMNRMFAAAVYRWLPRAGIVTDTYHFQRMVNQGLHEALRQLRKEQRFSKLKKDYEKRQRAQVSRRKGEIRRTRFLLFRRRSDLTEAEDQVLEEWTRQIPELGVWYDLKEKFLNIFQLQDGELAERQYDEWEGMVSERLPGAFPELRTAMKNWRRAIFNYFEGRITNALTEAVNGRIKELQLLGRGYQFVVLKALLLYAEYKQPPLRPSKKKRRRKPRPLNPDSKAGRLKSAFEAQDKTLGLIPNPFDNDEWSRRFEEVLKWLSANLDAVKPSSKKSFKKAGIVKNQIRLFDDAY